MKDQIQDLIKCKYLTLSEYSDAHELYDVLYYDGAIPEVIDSNIDICYYDLRQWAVNNYEYVEQAIEEGLCEGVSDFHKLIQCGQYLQLSEQAREAVSEIFEEAQA